MQQNYRALLGTLLYNSNQKEDRTGTGTHSVFGRQIKHRMKDGFPLLTTKKMAIKSIMHELKWFLKGGTNVRELIQNNCNIWNGDAYQQYCKRLKDHWESGGDLATREEFARMIEEDDEFARIWGDLGPIYGKQWRNWNGFELIGGNEIEGYNKGYDQIAQLLEDIKRDPDSRRLMVSAWNVADLEKMALPPCHYGFQVYTTELTESERQEEYAHILNKSIHYTKKIDHVVLDKANVPRRKISLLWNQRSVDTFLGLPFNIASYGMLLCLLAKEVNMVPDELIGNLGDTHLYSNHVDQAEEQLTRAEYPLPQLELENVNLLKGEFDYKILNYKHHEAIKAPLSN